MQLEKIEREYFSKTTEDEPTSIFQSIKSQNVNISQSETSSYNKNKNRVLFHNLKLPHATNIKTEVQKIVKWKRN